MSDAGAKRRLFVAVRPPEDVLDAVEAVVVPARHALVGPRWTTRDQWHLTLQFLGWVDDVEVVASALSAVRVHAPFAVQLGGGGAFPRVRKARVLWLGTRQGDGELSALADTVAASLAATGFVPEDRPHHGHLTLARLKVPADVTPCLAAVGDGEVGGAWTVRDVVLYESHLLRAGARYDAVARVELEG